LSSKPPNSSPSSSSMSFKRSLRGFAFRSECNTRRIFPVLGSRSTRASPGSMILGMAFEIASLEDVEDLESGWRCGRFSTPPVALFRREVRPKRR
jgi:hypothetical protein